MIHDWLDPLFLEMFYDRYFRGTVLAWQAVWQPVVWLIMGLVASLLWARRPAHAHRFLLLACLAAVLTPVLSILVERMNWGVFRRPSTESTYALLAPQASAPDNAGSAQQSIGVDSASEFVPAARVTRPLSAATVLFWMWLALSALVAARLLISLGLGWRLLARAKPLHDENLRAALEAAASKLGLSSTPALRESDSIRSPVIYGWGRQPILLLPPPARRAGQVFAPVLSRDAWVGIFCHELAHCQRRDHRSGLLAELLVILMPWNPLA